MLAIGSGSWKGGVDRRMFSLQYFKNPKIASETAAMQAHVQGAVDQVRSLRSPQDSAYRSRGGTCCCLDSYRRSGLLVSTLLNHECVCSISQRREIREKGFQTKNKDGVFGLARGYPQHWLDNTSQHPERARWIEFLQAWGLVGGEHGAPTTW